MSSVIQYAIIGTFLSHPFDVLFTKIASQRYIKYQNIIQTFKVVYTEEKLSKLFGSGLVPRLISMIASAYVMGVFYNPLLTMVREAY
jgi:hypothetical protein